jgi:ribonuclease J
VGSLNVCIHRGAKQIGGSCVELEEGGARLILDLGLPLDAKEATSDLLPPVDGIHNPDPSLLGVVLSHPHQDHHGLMRLLPPSVPIFMGAAAERIIAAAAMFIRGGVPLRAAGHLTDGVPFDVGPFRVTPYLVDHSAYDSYALAVQSGGKTLFYSGDLRAHGRKAAMFQRLLSQAPRNVDALLLEGSSIGRLAADGRFPTEQELEDSLAELASETRGAVLVCSSAQNIDRVVTVFRAARRSGRVLIIDLYGAVVLAATGNPNIPQSHWADVRLFVPEWQRIHVKRKQMFDLLNTHTCHRVYPENLAALAPDAIFMFRPSMASDLEKAECLAGAQMVWSQWEGYLSKPAFASFLDWQKGSGIPMELLHTSGHASILDLQRLAKAVNPKRLVPIHSFEPGGYAEFFSNVECRNDGERWSL